MIFIDTNNLDLVSGIINQGSNSLNGVADNISSAIASVDGEIKARINVSDIFSPIIRECLECANNVKSLLLSKVYQFENLDQKMINSLPSSFFKGLSSGVDNIMPSFKGLFSLADIDYQNLKVSSEYFDLRNLSEEERKKYIDNLNVLWKKYMDIAKSDRQRAVTDAKFFAYMMPKLPYFWGGGHDGSACISAISYTMGTMQTVTNHDDNDYIYGNDYLYGYDCSGLVAHNLYNANFDKSMVLRTAEYQSRLGDIYNISSESIENAKPGDLAIRKQPGKNADHIGMIIDVNKVSHEITVVHSSGSGGGINVTTENGEGKIVRDDIGTSYDINHEQSDKYGARPRDPYFTHVVYIEYPDEKNQIV